MQKRNRLLLLVLLGIWFGLVNGKVLEARDASHVCDEICGSGASCDQECWLTQFDFDQDYPSTTCGDQDYSCCGDGACDPATEGCNACPDDCGYVDQCPGLCYITSQCPSGDVCNSAHECVPYTGGQGGNHTPPCGGSCTNDHDCCGSDMCIGSPGQMYCAIPSSTYCPDSPSCTSNYDCDSTSWCGGMAMSAYDSYCDPGIGRCQWNDWGYGCPASDFSDACY
jgi:hypothetical protein